MTWPAKKMTLSWFWERLIAFFLRWNRKKIRKLIRVAKISREGESGSVIESLRVVNFRCFEHAAVTFAAEGHVFVGENAQGKTSLLEAVCLLLRLQSPRARQVRQLIREGAEGFGIAGTSRDHDLQVRGDRKGLSLKCDGDETASRRDYLTASGLVVWMGNDDLDLVRGGGESRRKYLDFLASQIDPEYRDHWMRYRKALAARNRYLKTRSPKEPEVQAYTRLLIEHGAALVKIRENLCETLTPRAAENHAAVSGKKEELGIVYLDRAKGDLAAAFAEVEEREMRRGITLAGPHRDDLKLTILGRNAREFGSEGQQRTLALALKLAQGEVLRDRGSREPVYLIDDVFGELDPGRRNALMERFPKDAQKLITTTTVDWWDGSERLPTTQVVKGILLD
ncbi:MAG: DNA replication/repair protein RecF [Akkermansiaceae bacterium]